MAVKKFIKSQIIKGLDVSVYLNGSQIIGKVIDIDYRSGSDPHIEIESTDESDAGFIYAVPINSDSVIIGYDPEQQKSILKKLKKTAVSVSSDEYNRL